MGTRVLLLWTDVAQAAPWVTALARGAFHAEVLDRDRARLLQVRKARPDVVLLDMRPPLERALRWCGKIRQDGTLSALPILAVAAGRAGAEIRKAVAAGADDGLPGVLSPDLLRTKIRNWTQTAPPAPEEGDIRVGALTLSQKRVQAYVGNRVIPDLSLMEFRVLRALAENSGRTLTRRQILTATHEESSEANERSVDVLVVGLRRKLRARAVRIETIYGIGYCLPRAEPPGDTANGPPA